VGVQCLSLSDCPQVTDLSILSSIRRLLSLNVSGCSGISDLRPLARHLRLRNLVLERCRAITSTDPLGNLSDLRSLNLAFCTGVTDVAPLVGCISLLELDLTGCSPENVSMLQVPTLLGLNNSTEDGSSTSPDDYKCSLGNEDLLGLPTPHSDIGRTLLRRLSRPTEENSNNHEYPGDEFT